jgi:hypothetical protein
MKSAALQYLAAGLCVLPARLAEKRPALASWKAFQSCRPAEAQITEWFARAEALCLLTGAVSGNLELLDFDCQAEAYAAWAEIVRRKAPGLLERLVAERSQSGGRHIIYRLAAPPPGNTKLARKIIVVADKTPVTYRGKQYVPRRVGDHWQIEPVLIETRGEGGIFLCAPSPGYVVEQGSFEALPVLTAEERAVLIDAARALDELVTAVAAPMPAPSSAAGDTDRPGDDFNRRGDVRAVLLKHGWTKIREGENEHWQRPGKTEGNSATLRDNVFFCFSSNAVPFEQDHAYPPFAVLAHLDYHGDFHAAAAALRAQGYGAQPDESGVDLSGILSTVAPDEPSESLPENPGPLPDELLRIPGFVSEVMDLTLETAPYPNLAMGFGGAVTFLAFLAGRKVRDSGDIRTNIYLLGLASSGVGKDWPRRVNGKIADLVGLSSCLGDSFASGEGLQDALFLTPAMLFQTDEIDGLLQAINKSRDGRYEAMMKSLLTFFTSAASKYAMRRKAGQKQAGEIDQPHLVIFGTAIPTHYYAALSERMLTNGLFARMIVVEAGKRPAGRDAKIIVPSERLVATAKWWADYLPGRGNLEKWHPEPKIVDYSAKARAILAETRQLADQAYDEADGRQDEAAKTVWSRVNEQVPKLALIYAVSENHLAPEISAAAVEWASRFILHQTRRMLYMAALHVADGEFDALCLKIIQRLRAVPLLEMNHGELLRQMKMRKKDFDDLMATMIERGDVEERRQDRGGPGPRAIRYRLRRATKRKDAPSAGEEIGEELDAKCRVSGARLPSLPENG